MDFFQNGFLSIFPDTLFSVSAQVMFNVVCFVVIAVVALELSKRLSRYGVRLAIIAITGSAIYFTGLYQLVLP